MDSKEWYYSWFNKDYLNLYSKRDKQEAEDQIQFLIEHLELNGKEIILDLACGSGRHSLALAKKGYHIIGVDASKTLIEEALKEVHPFPSLSVSYLVGDMLHLDYNHVFDLVISMFTSFGYFERDEENWQVFQSVRKCLKDGGQYFLDFLHPEEVKRSLIPYEEKVVKGETVKIHKSIENNKAVKVIEFPNRTYRESVSLYSREEIESKLKENQFELIEVWNDYKGNPWRADGTRQLFRCVAR